MGCNLNTATRGTREGGEGLVLVRSCRAGVTSGDGRHPPCGQAARPELDAGCASRCASVLRTPSAPAERGPLRAHQGIRNALNSVGHPGLPEGPQMTPSTAPYFARGHPGTPRGRKLQAGSPAAPPALLLSPPPKGCAPGPLGCTEVRPGSPAMPPGTHSAIRPRVKNPLETHE